jgi:hypothetical protein
VAKKTTSKKGSKPSSTTRHQRPAMTPEARENQLIAMATDLAEQQLRDGTASSQVITHYLKLGSSRNRAEVEKLKNEVRLLKSKSEAIDSAKETDKIYKEALKAMRSYSGLGGGEDEPQD